MQVLHTKAWEIFGLQMIRNYVYILKIKGFSMLYDFIKGFHV